MEGQEETPTTPFAPKAVLVRTPPSGFGVRAMDSTEDMTLTPAVPARPSRPRGTPPPPPLASKRPLTSPDERRPVDVVRMCRPVSSPPGLGSPQSRLPLPTTAGSAVGTSSPVAGTSAATPSTPSTAPAAPVVPAPAARAAPVAGDALAPLTKVELIDLVNRELRAVMTAATAHPSKLNKEATNAIGASVQHILAVVATLSLRLSERDVELSEARLKASQLELEVTRAKAAPMAANMHASAPAPSYASALRVSKRADPVPIPSAQGPVLAFYPAPEHTETFKTAEQTKAELKKAINPQLMQVQVDRVRKIGNAGVVVQTTCEASAEKLRKATPATLRVTEPKRRSPLVCLRHVDGEADYEDVMKALHDQNYRETEWTLERIRGQCKLAFKKRGRGTSTVVLECSPQLREALLKKERLYIGWQVIEVVDFLSVTCCRKCHQYGHPIKYCRSVEAYCGKCGAQGHAREDCKSETECCATCKRFGKPEAANHTTAASVCPARQYAEARSVSNTNYGQ